MPKGAASTSPFTGENDSRYSEAEILCFAWTPGVPHHFYSGKATLVNAGMHHRRREIARVVSTSHTYENTLA